MIYNKANEVTEEPFESLLYRSQIGLETPLKDSDFIFYCVNLLLYKFHKISVNCGGSYSDSPNWIKTKKQQ